MRCSWVRIPKSSTAFFNSCSLVVLNECGCDTKGIDCVDRDMEVGANIRLTLRGLPIMAVAARLEAIVEIMIDDIDDFAYLVVAYSFVCGRGVGIGIGDWY
mmetsp:Transcript_36227/g.41636  ORF Transcript_36227/g.41636 Transcript_36227/m.41636 type:complete len:101 (+) Transcript_36227:328-630(+)